MPENDPQESPKDGQDHQWTLFSRNGRKIACLPCRRRKLACDHGLPSCQRCQKARTTTMCIYESAPMDANKRQRRSSASSAPVIDPETTPQPDMAAAAVTETQRVPGRGSIRRTEFLGPTSIPTFLQEIDGHLISSPDAKDGQTSSPRSVATPGVLDTAPVKDHVMSMAIEVLQCIPDIQMSTLLIRRCQSPVDGWVRPAVYRLSNSLHETFKPYGKTRRANLAHMAQILSRNASNVLEESQQNAEQWLASISGLNFRWECVGILFAYWATSSMRRDDEQLTSTGNWSEIGEKKADLSNKYMQCIHHCIDLCSRKGAGSSLLVHLLLKASHLASVQHGDASLVADRLLAEATSVITSMGMHVSTTPDMTSFTTELHRRLFAHVFIVDKNTAILTGRPPRLSHRYCSAPIPLDLSDEIVMSMPGDLVPMEDVAPDRVDAQGWSTDGVVYKTTLTRARALGSHVRDAILEIALGVGQVPNIETLLQLKQRQMTLHRQLPQILHLDNIQVSATMDMSTRFAKSLARLDHLQNLFFINRLLVKAATSTGSNLSVVPLDVNACRRELVQVSFDILVVILGFWTHGTHGPSALQINYDWLIVSYACPAAGVLCGELLQPHALRDGETSGPRRSEVVHQLSLLSGFLTWIGPEAANASLSMTVKDLIHRVQDQLLNGPAARDQPEGVGADSGLNMMGVMSDMAVPNDFHELFGLELLDSFDWLRP